MPGRHPGAPGGRWAGCWSLPPSPRAPASSSRPFWPTARPRPIWPSAAWDRLARRLAARPPATRGRTPPEHRAGLSRTATARAHAAPDPDREPECRQADGQHGIHRRGTRLAGGHHLPDGAPLARRIRRDDDDHQPQQVRHPELAVVRALPAGADGSGAGELAGTRPARMCPGPGCWPRSGTSWCCGRERARNSPSGPPGTSGRRPDASSIRPDAGSARRDVCSRCPPAEHNGHPSLRGLSTATA